MSELDFILLKVSLFSALFGWAWVDLLTENRGLLDFLPKYYPKFLTPKPLQCAYCFGGWIAFAIMLKVVVFESMYYGFEIENIFYVIFAPLLTFAIVHMIKK